MSTLTLDAETALLTADGATALRETVAVEAVYTVALNGRDIGTAMVLETGLEEFGAGFLFGQGYLTAVGQVREVYVCPEGRIEVLADVDESAGPREVIITSGCGGTGRISREMLEGAFEPLAEAVLGFEEIGALIQETYRRAPLGPATHCVHACSFWSGGRLAACYEDVGRHNAVDKVIGAMLLGRIPRAGAVYTTGRLTSDMVLKCGRIGVPIVVSRTAPSSLGLAIARRADLTLAAYARPHRINVFHRPDRILPPPGGGNRSRHAPAKGASTPSCADSSN